MEFKNLKCVKISKSEYDDIKFIESIANCIKDGVDKTKEYLIRDKKVDANLNDYVLGELAWNLFNAVMNDYKYMKVVD